MVPERPSPGTGLLAVAGLSAIFALSIALAGLATRHWDVSRFVTAGNDFTDRTAAPPNLFTADGSGFDGQFFYRLALDTFTSARSTSGITLDDPPTASNPSPTRSPPGCSRGATPEPRPGPWSDERRRPDRSGSSPRLMRSLGRPPLWGLLIPLYPSFTTSLWRDTSEILAALLVLSGLVALRC